MANSLGNLVTLTTVHRQRPDWLKAAMTNALTGLRRRYGPYPWLWVPERSGSGRLHAHLLAAEWVGAELTDRWAHGFVHVKRLQSIEEQRNAATYLSKDFDRPCLPSRYYRSRGYQPEYEVVTATSRREFMVESIERFGGQEPSQVHGGEGDSGWPGLVAFWDEQEP